MTAPRAGQPDRAEISDTSDRGRAVGVGCAGDLVVCAMPGCSGPVRTLGAWCSRCVTAFGHVLALAPGRSTA